MAFNKQAIFDAYNNWRLLGSTNVGPSNAVDVVGIFDSDYNQLFTGARAFKAAIFETSKVFEHPLEDGSSVSDHRIINPTEIDMQLFITGRDYRDIYRAIKQWWLAGESLTVRTRTDDYPNMIIVNMPHEEEPQLWETVRLVVTFREMILVQSQFQPMPARSVRRSGDQSTVKRGDQQGNDSTLYKIFGRSD